MRELLGKALRTLIVFAVPTVMVGALLTPHVPRHQHHGDATTASVPFDDARNDSTDSVDSLDDSATGPDGSTATHDLLGNEVSEAVAEYKLDAAGSLYEVHSPQTELPRLGSPKS